MKTAFLLWMPVFVFAQAPATAPAAAAAAAPCPMANPMIERAGVQLRWHAIDTPIAVSKPFAMDVQVCPATAVLKRVDAQMPEHRHGMNYRTSLVPTGTGSFRAQGLMFHMPGRWELRFDVESVGESGKTTEKLTQSFELK